MLRPIHHLVFGRSSDHSFFIDVDIYNPLHKTPIHGAYCFPRRERRAIKMTFLRKFMSFLLMRHNLYLAPALIVILLLDYVIVLTDRSAVTPFAYTLSSM